MHYEIVQATEVIQCGDIFLYKYICLNCNLENMGGTDKISCVHCKAADYGGIELPRIRSKFRLVAGTFRKKRYLLKKHIRFLIEQYGSECQYCAIALTLDTIILDHIVPLCVGGSNDVSNLALSCQRCNSIAGPRVFKDMHLKRAYIMNKRAKTGY